MKTTVDISDDTYEEAKRVAAKERTSIRALIEEGLRHVLGTRRSRRTRFALRRVTVKGKGLSPEFASAGWSEIRDAAYRGRGA